MKKIRNLIASFKYCAEDLLMPLLFHSAQLIFNCFLGIILANTLGSFSDSIFEIHSHLETKRIILIVLCVFAVSILLPAIGFASDVIMLRHSLRHDIKVLDCFLRKSPEEIAEFSIGELQFQLEDAPNTLRIEWVNIFGRAFAVPICLGCFMFFSLQISWELALVMIIVSMTQLVIPNILKSKLAFYDAKAREYTGIRKDQENDVIRVPYIVKLWGIGDKIISRIDKTFREFYSCFGKKYVSWNVLSKENENNTIHFSMILFLIVGSFLVATSRITPGNLASILLYFSVLQSLLGDIAYIIQHWKLMQQAAQRVKKITWTKTNESCISVNSFKSLSGEHIHYEYPGKKIVYDAPIEVKCGDKICIIGDNGCGKTTFARILASLLSNYSGELKVNGIALNLLNADDWRELVSYASQNPFIFSGTVFDNIVFDRHVEESFVFGLTDKFGLKEYLNRKVSNSSGLSGGEKQKISILRSLVKNAELMIFDEPTNHLDNEMIDVLIDQLLTSHKTVLVISHDGRVIKQFKSYINLNVIKEQFE